MGPEQATLLVWPASAAGQQPWPQRLPDERRGGPPGNTFKFSKSRRQRRSSKRWPCRCVGSPAPFSLERGRPTQAALATVRLSQLRRAFTCSTPWVAAILLGQRHSRLLREGVKSARTGAPASGITWSVAVAVSLSEHAVPGRGEDETGPRDDKESGGPWVTPGAVQSVGAKVGICRCKKFVVKRGRGRLVSILQEKRIK